MPLACFNGNRQFPTPNNAWPSNTSPNNASPKHFQRISQHAEGMSLRYDSDFALFAAFCGSLVSGKWLAVPISIPLSTKWKTDRGNRLKAWINRSPTREVCPYMPIRLARTDTYGHSSPASAVRTTFCVCYPDFGWLFWVLSLMGVDSVKLIPDRGWLGGFANLGKGRLEAVGRKATLPKRQR